MAGSFFTGLLAVLVATPCTAPFMGVAVAAGLAAPPAVTVLVFAVMGLGLAAPYVALASMPGLARLMPRPGRWMEVLKQALAFPMYGAAAWLVWVVSQEAGPNGVLGTAAGSGAGRVRRLGVRDHPGLGRAAAAARADGGDGGGAGGAGGVERDLRVPAVALRRKRGRRPSPFPRSVWRRCARRVGRCS